MNRITFNKPLWYALSNSGKSIGYSIIAFLALVVSNQAFAGSDNYPCKFKLKLCSVHFRDGYSPQHRIWVDVFNADDTALRIPSAENTHLPNGRSVDLGCYTKAGCKFYIQALVDHDRTKDRSNMYNATCGDDFFVNLSVHMQEWLGYRWTIKNVVYEINGDGC